MIRPMFVMSLLLLTFGMSGCLLGASFIRVSITPGTVRVDEGGKRGADVVADPDAVLSFTVRCSFREGAGGILGAFGGAISDEGETVQIDLAGLPAGADAHLDPTEGLCANDPDGDTFGGTLNLVVGDTRPGRYEVTMTVTLTACELERGLGDDESASPFADPTVQCRDSDSFVLIVREEGPGYMPPNY